MIDHWWQTETGWPIVANPAGIELLPIKPGSPTRPLPGWDVQVLDADGRPVTDGSDGAIVVKLPMPPGLAADAVERRRAFRLLLHGRVRRLLPHRRRRPDRRRRLRVRDGPHRRRDQRGRAPAVHRRHGGGARRAPRRRRVRGDRRGRPDEGPGPARFRGAQGRRRAGRRRSCRPSWCSWSATRSARWPRCATSPSCRRCPRPAPGRSCARRCAASPTALDEPVPSTIDDAAVLDALRPVLRKDVVDRPMAYDTSRSAQLCRTAAHRVTSRTRAEIAGAGRRSPSTAVASSERTPTLVATRPGSGRARRAHPARPAGPATGGAAARPFVIASTHRRRRAGARAGRPASRPPRSGSRCSARRSAWCSSA